MRGRSERDEGRHTVGLLWWRGVGIARPPAGPTELGDVWWGLPASPPARQSAWTGECGGWADRRPAGPPRLGCVGWGPARVRGRVGERQLCT